MNKAKQRERSESLAKTSKNLMLNEPFYGLLLMALNKSFTDKVPTAGVTLKGINYELYISPDFWDKLHADKRYGLLKHELLHIAFFHLVNYDKYENKKLLNIAMDMEINQYIDEQYLPKGGIHLYDFQVQYPTLDLPERAGTKHYYDELSKVCNNAICPDNQEWQFPDGDSTPIPGHDYDGSGLNEAEQKMVEAQTKHIVNQVADQVRKSRGNIPGEMSEILKRINQLDPPVVDWRGFMRRFVGKSTKTYTKKSRRKYNKRTPDFPGLKIKRQKHILAGIDTSGSVNTSELKEFLNELHHIKKTGAEVTVVQCDTAISHIGKFDPKKDIEIHGRGGTSFQPVIDYYNENMNQYSCLMYFTDGEAHAPQNARGHILWIISSNGSAYEEFPGLIINIENKN